MGHFSYSLLLTLLHSLWQSALLLCLYYLLCLFIKRADPVYKRNLLFISLAVQCFLSISTFFIYYSGDAFIYTEYIMPALSVLSLDESYIQKYAPWLSGIYALALLYKTARLFISWKHFKTTGRSAWIKPSVNLRLFTTVKATEFGIHRKVSLWYSNNISTPLTFGFFKPVILLPVALVNNLSITETETLIIHEITHIKSNDYFLNWLLLICETVFFFNPFVKLIASRIRLEREKNCDSRVLQFNYTAIHYAETLLKTARFRSNPGTFFLAAAFRNAQLVKRISFFTEEKNLQFRKRNYRGLAILPLAAFILCNIFLMNFIKHKEIMPSTAPVMINTGLAGNYYETTNDQFSTTAIAAPAKAEEELASQTIEPALEEALSSHLQQVAAIAEKEALIEKYNLVAGAPVMPVAMEEPIESKEITLMDENSATGKSITKVYRMYFEKGEWRSRLMWTITTQRTVSDSLRYLRDTIRATLNSYNYNAQ